MGRIFCTLACRAERPSHSHLVHLIPPVVWSRLPTSCHLNPNPNLGQVGAGRGGGWGQVAEDSESTVWLTISNHLEDTIWVTGPNHYYGTLVVATPKDTMLIVSPLEIFIA